MSGEERQDSAPPPGKAEERPGLPDSGSIIEETPFTSPKGNRYRILKTNEMDAYDQPPKKRPRRGRKP